VTIPPPDPFPIYRDNLFTVPCEGKVVNVQNSFGKNLFKICSKSVLSKVWIWISSFLEKEPGKNLRLLLFPVNFTNKDFCMTFCPVNIWLRVKAKPTIGARQRRKCLSSCSPLCAPCAAKTSHPASHPHNTLACNHTSLPHAPRPHPSSP